MPGEILRLENVCKWVAAQDARTEILRGVSLSIRSGEFVAIMGPSGSGKSTLLSLIGLLDSPSAGSLRLMGTEASRLPEKQLAALRSRTLGFIFQTFNLLPYLNARQNVELPMAYAGRHDRAERSQQLLAQVRLAHRETAYPATLSGGERQRVAVARALANNPALILADEPTGSLDSASGAQIMRLLSDLHHQGAAIVLVTHDESIARRSERILTMRDGKLE